MTNKFHRNLVNFDNHAVNAKTYATILLRDDDFLFNMEVENINKIVRVEDNDAGEVAYYLLVSIIPAVWLEVSNTAFDSFIELTDTPTTYTGQAGKVVQVNATLPDPTAVEFSNTLIVDEANNRLSILYTGTPSATLGITPKVGGDIGLLIRGAVGQTANYLRIQHSDEVDILSITEQGHVLFRNETNVASAFQIQNAGGGATIFNVNTTGSDLAVTISNDLVVNGTTFNVDSSASSVGIGNNAPTDTLHVTGSLRLTLAFKDGGNLAGADGAIFRSTSTATDWSGVLIDGSDNVTIPVDSNFLVDNPTFFVNGTTHRVGIGTIAPTVKLDVVGDGNFSTDLGVGNDLTVTNDGFFTRSAKISGAFTDFVSLRLDSIAGALLLNRLTDDQRDNDITAQAGMIIYNTDTNEVQEFNGSNWIGTLSFDTFLELTDVPNSYGTAGAIVQINSGSSGLEFGQLLRTGDDPTFNNLLINGDLTVIGGIDVHSNTLFVNEVANSTSVGTTDSFAKFQVYSTDDADTVALFKGRTAQTGDLFRIERFGVTAPYLLMDKDGYTTFQNRANNVNAFRVLNALGTTHVFNVDTSNARVGIGAATPGFSLDVVGDGNFTTDLGVGNDLTVTRAATITGANVSISLGLNATTGALLLNRLTEAQRDSLAASNGMMIFNTTANGVQQYNGTWRSLDTFLGLKDVPDSYTGDADKVLRVNTGETALEFSNVTIDASNNVVIPVGSDFLVDSPTFSVDANLNSVGIGIVVPTATLDVVGTGKFSSSLTVSGLLTAVTAAEVSGAVAFISLALNASTGALRLNRLTDTQRNNLTPLVGMMIFNTTANGVQSYNGSWLSLDTFLGLGDVDPTTYTGQEGKVVQVNSTPDGLEFGQALLTTSDPVFGSLTLDDLAVDVSLLFTNSGNSTVGINTTIATEALHVVGSARVTEAFFDSGNSAGTDGQVLSSQSTGTMTQWIDGPVTGPGSSTDTAIARWNGVGGDTLQDSVTLVATDGTVTIPGGGGLVVDSPTFIIDATAKDVKIGNVAAGLSDFTIFQLADPKGLTFSGTPTTGSSSTTEGITMWLGGGFGNNHHLFIGNTADIADSLKNGFRFTLGFETANISGVQLTAQANRGISLGNPTGKVGIGFDPGTLAASTLAGQCHIETGATANIGLVLQGVSSQTAALMEVRRSDALILARIDRLGRFNIGSFGPAEVDSVLHVQGSMSIRRVAFTTSLSTVDEVIIAVTGTLPITVTISSSDIIPVGRLFIIKDETGTANNPNPITIATQGAQTIDGATTVTITAAYGVIRLYSNGANLFSW